MSFFKPLDEPEQFAIIVEGGVYKQAPLFTRAGHLYAKFGGGFVRLGSDGSTSRPKLRLDALICDLPLCMDRFGRLCDASVTGAVPLPTEKVTLLLGSSNA